MWSSMKITLGIVIDSGNLLIYSAFKSNSKARIKNFFKISPAICKTFMNHSYLKIHLLSVELCKIYYLLLKLDSWFLFIMAGVIGNMTAKAGLNKVFLIKSRVYTTDKDKPIIITIRKRLITTVSRQETGNHLLKWAVIKVFIN